MVDHAMISKVLGSEVVARPGCPACDAMSQIIAARDTDIAALESQLTRMREALEPFVSAEYWYDSIRPECWQCGWHLTEDIERARRALEQA